MINLCKQFAYLATHRKLFRTLYLSPHPIHQICPRCWPDDEDVLLNVTDKVASWRLSQTPSRYEELFILYDFLKSRTPHEFFKWLDRPLKNLVSLSLIGGPVHVKEVTPFIDPIKLKVLDIYPQYGINLAQDAHNQNNEQCKRLSRKV